MINTDYNFHAYFCVQSDGKLPPAQTTLGLIRKKSLICLLGSKFKHSVEINEASLMCHFIRSVVMRDYSAMVAHPKVIQLINEWILY